MINVQYINKILSILYFGKTCLLHCQKLNKKLLSFLNKFLQLLYINVLQNNRYDNCLLQYLLLWDLVKGIENQLLLLLLDTIDQMIGSNFIFTQPTNFIYSI